MKREDGDAYLNQFLRTCARYIRREAALRWAAWGLVSGLGAAVLLNAATWALPLMARHLPALSQTRGRLALSVCTVALAALAAALLASLSPRSLLAVARLSDARMRLRARLATALEIQGGYGTGPVLPVPPEIAARQRADTCAAAARADPQRAFAPPFPRRQALAAAPLLAVLIASFVLPNPQEAVIAQRQAEQAAIAGQVARLEALRDEIAADERLSTEDREALLREVDDAIHDLKGQRPGQQPGSPLRREEAVARLSEAEERLKPLLRDDTPAIEQALQQVGRQATQEDPGGAGLRTRPRTRPVGQALQAGDYEGAAQAMDQAAGTLSQDLAYMSAAQVQETAQHLEAMAEAAAPAAPELAQALRQAATATRQGDAAAAQRSLQHAAEQIRQAGQQIAAQEATERALGQIQEGRRAIAQGSIQPGLPGQGGEQHYDPIYAPERLGGEGGEHIVLPGPQEGEREKGEGGKGEEEKVLVPYEEVYTDYQAQAASALESSYIPLGLKEYVRDYFSSLDPGE
jgi:hypothetical protein